MVLEPIWPKILNPSFFKFHKIIEWLILANNYPKTSALSQSLSNIFFVSQTHKFMKIFQNNSPPPQKKVFFFGRRNLLNVVLASFNLTQHSYKEFFHERFSFLLRTISFFCVSPIRRGKEIDIFLDSNACGINHVTPQFVSKKFFLHHVVFY